MLEINQLTIKTIKEGFELVKNLSMTLNPHEKIAIIGHEGTGKSTLLKLIGAPEQLNHIQHQGQINVKGKVGYLEQDIKSQWKHTNIIDYFIKDNPNGSIIYERYELLKDLNKLLKTLDFKESSFDESKTMADFSGGEVIKLGLAKLLLSNPDILLLDEPTNDLDFETLIFLEKFMIDNPKPILFISHDERLLENVATGIIHLSRTKKRTQAITTFEKMGYYDYKSYYINQYESQLTIAKKQRAQHKAKMERWRKIYQKVEHQQNQAVRDPSLARLLKKKVKSMKTTEKRFQKEEEKFIDIPEKEAPIEIFFDPAIKVPNKKVILDYQEDFLMIGQKIIAHDLALKVVGPQKIAIIGKNGVGKTTWMQSIYQRLKTRDDIILGYMPQNYDQYFHNETVLSFFDADKDKVKETIVRKYLGSLSFERNEMNLSTSSLSGGQKAKLYLLKMVLNQCNVLLLDEPTRNLSPLSLPEITELFNHYQGTILCITHDRAFIENVFDKMIELTPQGLIEK